MIPKVIHYCWFGGSPLPKDAQKCINSWKKFFPEYKIKEWNEQNFDINSCQYIKEAYEAKKYAFVSDYVRFWVIYHEGGIYFDTDVEVIKDMSHIIEKGAFMGFEKNSAIKNQPIQNILGVNPGLALGSNKLHFFYKEILEFYDNKKHFSIEDGTVVDYTTNLLRKYGMKEKNCMQKIAGITIYPAEVFCPIDSTTGIKNITEKTVSIHHYSCTWIDHNTISWKLHEFKNFLIKIFGEKWILKLCRFFK